MKRVLSLAAACAALLSAGHSADAAIMVVNSLGAPDVTSGGESTQTLNFDATGGTKLVVAITAEENGTGPLGTPTVTYNSVPLLPAVTQLDADTGQQFSGIFYLDNPATGTNEILVDWGAEEANGVGFGAFALTGAAAGAPASTGSTTTSPGTIILSPAPDADSFAVAAYLTNSSSSGVPPFDFTGGSGSGPLEELFDDEIGSARAAIISQNGVGGPTTYNVSGGRTGNSIRPAGVGAAFAAIPEPATLGLLALGVCGAMFRRRVRDQGVNAACPGREAHSRPAGRGELEE